MKSRLFTTLLLTANLAFLFPILRASPIVRARSQDHPPSPIAATVSAQTPTASPRELSLEERGDLYMARKNYEAAAVCYYQVLKQSGFKRAQVWNKLGIAYQQQSKYRNALEAYKNAARCDKKFAEAWNNLGTVRFMQSKYRASVKYYKHAIQLRSNDAAFHLNLGTAYQYLKKYKQAEQEFSTALDIDPDVLTQQSSLGTVIRARGTDFQFYYYMAKAFASKGRAEEAVRYLRHAFEDGYKDRKRINEDPDFQKISHYPAYVELMKNPPVAITD